MPTQRKPKSASSQKANEQMAADSLPLAPEVFNAYLRSMSLESVCLNKVSSSLSRPAKKDENLDLHLTLNFEDYPSEKGITFDMGFHLEVSGEDEAEVAEVDITYRVAFSAEGPPPENFGKVFGVSSLHRLVFPYVRELVTSIASRMELPRLYLPLDVFGGDSEKPSIRAKKVKS